MKLSPKQTSLLAASGELSPPAQKKFLKEIAENPELKAEFETACQRFDVLGVLPIPEPSAAERREIPARIKQAIHLALEQHEKKARRPRMLVRWAMSGLAMAACLTILVSTIHASRQQSERRDAQVAQIHTLIRHATQGGSMDMTLPDPGLDQMAAEGADGAWLSYHAQADGTENLVSDPSAPPGSF